MNKNKRLKIGLFIDNFYPAIDGVVIAVDNIARELSENNDVVVVAPYMGDNSKDLDHHYTIKRVGSIPMPVGEYRIVTHKFGFSNSFKELVKENFDIIHIHSPFNIGKLGLKVAKELNIPCICTVHTRFDYEIKRFTKNEYIVKLIMKGLMNVFNACDKCIVVNEFLEEELHEFGYKKKSITIYNGTDLVPIKDKEKAISFVNKLHNFKKDETVLLFVGRLIDIKNIFFVADVLKKLKEDNFKFKMFFVGTGPDENKLKSIISNYKLNDVVYFTGKVTDRNYLSALYLRSNLLLFPSLMDTSSLVRIEAAVNETPGLFITDSLVGKMIKDDYNGFNSKMDVNTYEKRIIEVISDKKLLTKVSKNARKTLGISWKEVSNQIYKLYLKTLKK